ncbi:associated molecule with the SH3 domain of STAM 1 isoform X2 [Wolffia australiana]
MDSFHGRICIAASAQKIDVDNRISLRFYYRIAGNLLKQADIYRGEKNIIDLYIMLLRFSSLVNETIPQHQDYTTCLLYEKNSFRKKLLSAITELEELKPKVQQRLEELNRKSKIQTRNWSQVQRSVCHDSLDWPVAEQKWTPSTGRDQFKAPSIYKDKTSQYSTSELQLPRLSLGLPRPNEETLSRHSILGPNGLYGQWRPTVVDHKVQYPSNLDLSPVLTIPRSSSTQISSVCEITPVVIEKTDGLEAEKSVPEQASSLQEDILSLLVEEQPSVAVEIPTQVDVVIRQPSPPPVLADVQSLVADLPISPSHCGHSINKETESLPDELIRAESPLEVHVSAVLMDSFLRVAKSNTSKNLETCGVLAGSLKNRKFYVTALIIPKQESTSNTCHTTNEEEIFDYQDKQSLFPLGWIHTHPTQSCFMSSVDLHTHYSYQIMLPEAIAIVMAPTDSTSPYGIFRLTTPGGMKVIRNCQQRGFHAHEQPPDGGPLYRRSADVRLDPSLKFDVVDFR